MAKGVAIEMWDGERKFLQQMGRKCGQHSLALTLISRRGSQPGGCIPLRGFTGVGLASARLTFSFAKTCRTGGTSASDQR